MTIALDQRSKCKTYSEPHDIRASPKLAKFHAELQFEGKGVAMPTYKYQIESLYPMVGPLLPEGGVTTLGLHDHALAIVIAAKSVTVPYGKEIRVVHVTSGEVIFRKTAATVATAGEE
jgi:hypothetical protein